MNVHIYWKANNSHDIHPSSTGYSILLGVSPKQLGVRYFALFLCITGIYTVSKTPACNIGT
jgi:hypothetical protein